MTKGVDICKVSEQISSIFGSLDDITNTVYLDLGATTDCLIPVSAFVNEDFLAVADSLKWTLEEMWFLLPPLLHFQCWVSLLYIYLFFNSLRIMMKRSFAFFNNLVVSF